MALKSVDPVRKMEQGLNPIKRGVFSNGVESQNVEFKSSQPKARLERDEYLKVIYAFANADGGRAD
ncbi:MAG: hypothetical protein M0Z70_06575 [Nitrospiraceae bacterium]|jgi:predicted HTH transcriptional regulator|nr:hypothetical protein [Nitrospiraceae bacterium]